MEDADRLTPFKDDKLKGYELIKFKAYKVRHSQPKTKYEPILKI